MDAATNNVMTMASKVPAVIILALAVVGIAAWVGMHLIMRRGTTTLNRRLMFAARILVGSLALWLVLSAMERFLTIGTSWPLWLLPVLGAAFTELIIALYALERQTVSRRVGLSLVAMRVAVLLLVVFMLVQPVLTWTNPLTIERFVAVLVDASASMGLVDAQMSALQKLQLAELFGIEEGDHPYQMERAAKELDAVRKKLAAQSSWLGLLGATDFQTLGRHLEERREAMQKLFGEAEKTVDEQATMLDALLVSDLPLESTARADVERSAKMAVAAVRDPIREAVKILEADEAALLARQYQRLLQVSSGAQTGLKNVIATVSALDVSVEEARFATLTDKQRAQVDEVANKTREAIARATLLAARGDDVPLVEQLQEKYTVKFYLFAAEAAQTGIDPWEAAAGQAAPEKSLPARRITDLAGAVAKALADIPAQQLSGILVVSDGRHNARTPFSAVVDELRTRKMPVCGVLIGSEIPPPDAAVVGVKTPDAVYRGDEMELNATIKLDGLKGEEVVVKLTRDGDDIDEEKIKVGADSFRTEVTLTDTPKDEGFATYMVEVQHFDNEIFKTNNTQDVHVAVTSERTKLLMIDGQARWEYRYVKNLFTGRDRTVQIQYVLMHPDLIQGAPVPPKVKASASRKYEESEATDLPKDEEEWRKFDVIFLGDVAPGDLSGRPGFSMSVGQGAQSSDDNVKIIEKFVSERGGTLIVSAGPRHMPHAYKKSSLLEMLPVTVAPSEDDKMPGPEPEFQITLSEAGRTHVIMQQDKAPDENLRIWSEIPEIHWRHPIIDTKPGATVLAFAMPKEKPAFFDPGKMSSVEYNQLDKQRREFVRKNALIVVQRFGLGRVVMLNFDRTWRLRYRVGDEYHHKFWGQVLRWATADKLQAGTDLVRIGTDKLMYAPGDGVRVRAKVTNIDRSGVENSENVAVKVFDGDTLVLTKKLAYVPDSVGIYEAELGTLPDSKTYRIELAGSDVDRALQLERTADSSARKVDKVETRVRFPAARTPELIELAADPTALEKLADASGGIVTGPVQAIETLGRFGTGTQRLFEQRQFLLWNSLPLWVIIVLLLTGEWLLRKKVGLT